MKTKLIASLTCLLFIAGLALAGNGNQGNDSTQAATVEITDKGYQPESLKLKPDVAARITFIRRTDETCAKEVVFKDYNVKKALPLNEPMVVEITPRKKGEFTFACGMNMVRGKLIVE